VAPVELLVNIAMRSRKILQESDNLRVFMLKGITVENTHTHTLGDTQTIHY
jgi:hypothetical protein